MNIDILKSNVSDNYFYVVTDDDGHAAVIDPVDAETTIEHISSAGYSLEWVVNTHFHPDHVAGDDAVLDAFEGARLTAGPDHPQISVNHDFDLLLSDGDILEFGDVSFQILETPGHTPGHISLLADGHLFSGDVIFVGGAGNCRFGGDPSVLFRTYRDVLAKLDDDVTFYPGHDYSKRNVEFALSLQPDHDGAQEMLERVESHDGSILLTTLGEERQYNPFFRYDDPGLRAALAERHPDVLATEREASDDEAEATFRTVRALRNNW